MIVLVSGGRDYEFAAQVCRALDAEVRRAPITLLMHGACKTGADHHAELWAKSHEVPYLGVPAEWMRFGASAGPRRNSRMVNFLRLVPDKLIAFSGGTGTADMIKKARAAGIPVEEVL